MSGLLPHRSAVFLDEMGVGVQWRLRNRPAAAPADGAPADTLPLTADALVDAAPPAALALAAGLPDDDLASSALAPADVGGAVAVDAHVPDVVRAVEPSSASLTTAAAAVPPAPPAAQDAISAAAQPAQAPSASAESAWDDAPAAVPLPAAASQAVAARHPATARPAQPPVPPARNVPSAPGESAWEDAAAAPPPAAAHPAAAPQPAADRSPAHPAAAQLAATVPPAQSPAPAARTAPSAPVESAWDDEPHAASAAASATLPAAAPRAPAPLASRPAASGPVTDEEIAEMDWPSLRASVDSCTRCRLCQTREAAVNGRGDEQATWMILDAAPNQDDEEYAEPITGNPGRLLDNMLRAVNQSTQQGAYITTLVKCRPQNEDGSQRAPTPEELSACRPYLERELQLTQTRVIVAVGHAAGKGLLGAAARGRIMLHGERPVVATYHPSDLLKRPEEKAKAWADLCLAKSAHAGRR